jgi:serine phosphatase RsbU (regulator of sigma subunit)
MLDEADPAAAMSRLNTVLAASGDSMQYVTAAAAAFRRGPDNTEVAVAIGGHPHPLLVRHDGLVETVGTTGPIIGWFQDSSYSTAVAALEPGDVLVMFTDGLLEAVAGHGETDDSAIREMLAPLANHSAAEIADRLDAAIGTHRRDDAAFVVARAL